MTDLQSCYFCGTPENVQEYAVVPPRLGGDAHSAALCEQCKDKLLRVIDPLIEQVETQAGDGAASTDAAASTPTSESDDGGIAMSSGNGSGPGGSTAGGDAADQGTTGDHGSSTDDTSDDGAPESGSAAPTGPAGTDAAETPPQYRRAMRMLSNREFPIPRTEVESMLAGAYDLEREEVDAVIDHAVEEGRLAEENGELREP